MCRVTSLCLARTRWLTMWDPEVLPRLLQNHFLQILQNTTEAGSWIPQYRQACSGKSENQKILFISLRKLAYLSFLVISHVASLLKIQIGSNCIRLIIWFKSDKIGSNWFKSNQIGSNWFKYDQKRSRLIIWIKLDKTGSYLIKSDQVGSSWFKMVQIDSY